MGISITQGFTGYVNPFVASVDTGWTISGIYAIHGSCNSGNIISQSSLGLVVGKQYVFKYRVDNYVSGSVNIIAGTTVGVSRTANGDYTETITVTGVPQLQFFSDGSLRLSLLSFYDPIDGLETGATISFNEKENKWVSEYSYRADQIIRFMDKLLIINNGELWLQNSSNVYNNFCGIQYSSQIIFVSNQDYEKNKLWFNIRMDSTGGWYVQSMNILPNDQFPNGMQTLMTKSNLRSIDGKLWGDILRDVTDPNFAYVPDLELRKAVSLFRGRMMQGGWAIVTLQNDDNTLATMSSAEFYYIDVQKSL